MLEPNAIAGPSTSGPTRRSLSPQELSHPQPPNKRQRTQVGVDDSMAPPSAVRKLKGRKKRGNSSDPVVLPTSRLPPDAPDDFGDLHITISSKAKDRSSPSKESQADGTIRCICGTHWDDGQMVQCDACQTWQHTKCYRVDFERLTKDSTAVWICIVCGPETWTGNPLDSEWANRMQKKEEERERVAALTKQLDMQAARNGSGRKGRAGRKPVTGGATGTTGPSSALAGSGATGITTDREEEVDEVESWRQVYVPSKQNIIEKDVRPHIRRFMSVYGPGSKFFTKALEVNRGWTTPSSKGKGKEREVTGYDILSRSLPIIVNADELASAENEDWVTVRSMHVPPAEVTPPISALPMRSTSPSASRPGMDPTVLPSSQQPPSGPPALTVVTSQNDYSYGNVFLLTVASNASVVDAQRHSNVPMNPSGVDHQRYSKSPPVQRNAAKVAARNLSPPPQARTAISPTTARSRRITPVQPDEEEPQRQVFAGPDGVPKSDPFTAQKYTLHTSRRAPPRTLLACFPANVSSHSAYLATPSNQYFHLGAPKPHVRVLGAPLEVALDARVIGGIGRFARSGCWPNAVLRTVVVKPDKRKRPKKSQRVEDDVDMDDDLDDTLTDSLQFGIFSLRELAEGEEVVIGWEWDDAHRIHRLPKLLLEEARMLLECDTVSFSEYESKYYETLCQTLLETFTSCACSDDPLVHTANTSLPNHRPNILSATEPTKTCALEELSRWVTRREEELDPKSAPSRSTPARDDDEGTEPDEELGRRVWEPDGPPPSQANPTLLVHPSIIGGPTSHVSIPPYSQQGHPSLTSSSFLHPSLQRNQVQVQKPQPFHASLLNPTTDRGSPGHSSMPLHPSLHSHVPLVAPKPISALDDARFAPPRSTSSSTFGFRPPSGAGSLASLIHPTDTFPHSGQSSRPASSSSHLAMPHRPEPTPISRPASSSQPNRLRQLWGRNVTEASLAVRDDEDDEDVLIRALGITLGPIIGSKRGVRIEDAQGGGLLGVKIVQGYGRVTSGDIRVNGKRKRSVQDEGGEGSTTSHAEKRRKFSTAVPPCARRRRAAGPKPRRPRPPSGQMDIDRAASPFEYPFTFSVPPLDPSAANTSSHGQEDVVMAVEALKAGSLPGSPTQLPTSHVNSLSLSPPPSRSNRSAMMSIANMLNSPTAPTFSRESFQRKMSRQEARSESRSPPPVHPPTFPHSDNSIRSPSPTHAHEDRFEPGPSPSVELPTRDTSWDSVGTNDTVAPPQRREGTPGVPIPSTLAVQGDAPNGLNPPILEQGASPPATATDIVPAEDQLQVSELVTTEAAEERVRPITPIPMVLPPSLIVPRWQSPSASSSREETGILGDRGVIEETPEMPEEVKEMPREVDRATQSSSPVPVEPLVIRGRLVTPPSRGNTPTPAPTSPEARRGPSHSTTGSSSSDEDESSEESEESDDEDDQDEDSDTSMASGSDDSDSLTPAPSPPVVAKPPIASSTAVAGTVEAPVEPSSSKPDDRVGEDTIPNFVENQAPTTDPATSPALVALDPSQRSTSVAISIDEPTNDLPPSSSTPIDTPQVPADLEEPTVPAIPVRRMTLKDYARRKKKDVAVSPTNQISPAGFPGPSAGWSSPLAGRGVPLPAHSSSEFSISSSGPAQGSQDLITNQDALMKAEPPPVSKPCDEDAVVQAAVNLLPTAIMVVRTSPPADPFRFPSPTHSPLGNSKPNGHEPNFLRTPSPVPEVSSPSMTPAPSSSSNPNDPATYHVPERASTQSPAPIPPTLVPRSVASPITKTSSIWPPTPIPKGTTKTMEDGEIDASQPSSPTRAPTRPSAVSAASSYQGAGRNISPRRGDDWERDSNPAPAHPRSFSINRGVTPGRDPSDRSPIASTSNSTSTYGGNPPPASSSSAAPKPPTNGISSASGPRPPIGPRSNAPPPSGPRALRGLEPRSQLSGTWDKPPRPWERHLDRDRDSDRDRDRDRDRARDDRYWRDSRPRGYRPRGK